MHEEDTPPAGEAEADESHAEQAAGSAQEAGMVADAAAGAVRSEVESALTAERDKYLRLAAEFDNFRKRNVRERQEAGWRAQADLVQGLVESLDDIMRFADLDPASTDSNTVIQGVNMVERKVLKSLGGHGLELVDPVGRPFDPAVHEAVGTESAESADQDDIVARVYQPGWVFRGQLLRPARVVVKQWPG